MQAADLEAGRKVFETVCAACHGVTGRPDPSNPVVQALDPQPADLSDPLFNSREPASDWHIVVTHGGPALGLSAAMPAQVGALSEDEIRNVVAYAKTLAPGSEAYPPGELNFFLPVRTKKAFPEDEIVWKSRVSEQDGDNVWRNVIEIEKRFGKRSMGVLEVIHEDDGEDSEITKVEAGAKTVLHWNLEKGSILSGALIYAIPDRRRRIGRDHPVPGLRQAVERKVDVPVQRARDRAGRRCGPGRGGARWHRALPLDGYEPVRCSLRSR